MVEISVVVPTYNGKAYLHQALQSVFDQTRLPDEVIVVDDDSTDGTPDLVREVAAHAPVPVHLIPLSRNSGSPAHPLNVGIEAARGELIAGLDQDDLFCSEKLQMQAEVLTHRPDISLVGSFSGSTNTPGLPNPFQHRVVTYFRNQGWQLESLPGTEALRLLIRWGNYMMGYPGFMFRKSLWRAKGGVDESLVVGSDYELVCWLCLQGRVAFLPRIHYSRRQHPDNLCNNKLKMYMDLARVRARYLNEHRWLLEDTELSEELRSWFRSFAYLIRLANRHGTAFECYRLLARVWGWDYQTLRYCMALPARWLWTQLSRKPPTYCEWTHPGMATLSSRHSRNLAA